jgi:hypothetical protein
MTRQYTRLRQHGTRSMYANYKCRCTACMEANTLYQRKYNLRAAMRPRELWVHGKRQTYAVMKCRCVECTRANAEYQRSYCKRPERKAYNQQLSREQYRRKRALRVAA